MSAPFDIEARIACPLEGIALVAGIRCHAIDETTCRVEAARLIVATKRGTREIALEEKEAPALSSAANNERSEIPPLSSAERAIARLDDGGRLTIMNAVFLREAQDSSGDRSRGPISFELRGITWRLALKPQPDALAEPLGRLRVFADGRVELSLHDGSTAMV